MKKFTAYKDVSQAEDLVALAKELKQHPFQHQEFGKNKTLGLVFLNPSLRTRLSTQKAAFNLGMNVMVLNLDKDSWSLELEDGTVMNQNSQEHIKDAAAVISQYCDIVGIRTFPDLKDREADYSEQLLQKFIKYAQVPIVSLESATRHPLQSLADLLTIEEHKAKAKPKVVLSWAPHPKALPQAVANSFIEWIKESDVELVVCNPEGMDLAPEFIKDVTVLHNQEEALKEADFVYAKNWSSYENYGEILAGHENWRITADKMQLTNKAKFMHCLPVRRNVVVTDEVLDSEQSLIYQQAENRTYAAQAVLLKLLGHE
ncbi:acetylornithine carbamoyltransferase [Marivirga atlantica]|jgi:N-succinyl-L-ornithine transcarbamylase|uniref:N-succinylornithine carbamoyltransferase n=1 Tax=Marivirga atlantica TaxID=1548457 RepID=A0A937DI09_9BACT|nr:N-acetylornithine carbamoyltransferase [Marivirga atlantica]MBL0766503.1 N-acetylornithine carbamoyltransferase [Marivirga atlantica]